MDNWKDTLALAAFGRRLAWGDPGPGTLVNGRIFGHAEGWLGIVDLRALPPASRAACADLFTAIAPRLVARGIYLNTPWTDDYGRIELSPAIRELAPDRWLQGRRLVLGLVPRLQDDLGTITGLTQELDRLGSAPTPALGHDGSSWWIRRFDMDAARALASVDEATGGVDWRRAMGFFTADLVGARDFLELDARWIDHVAPAKHDVFDVSSRLQRALAEGRREGVSRFQALGQGQAAAAGPNFNPRLPAPMPADFLRDVEGELPLTDFERRLAWAAQRPGRR